MHKKKIAPVIALLLIASMSLTACGGAAVVPKPTELGGKSTFQGSTSRPPQARAFISAHVASPPGTATMPPSDPSQSPAWSSNSRSNRRSAVAK